MMTLSFHRPPTKVRGRRVASYRPSMILIGISRNAGCVLLGEGLGRVGAVAECFEEALRLGPGLASLGHQPIAGQRASEEPQRDGLPLPVARGLVVGQRLREEIQSLGV